MAEKKSPNRKARRSIAATRRKYAEALGLRSEEEPLVEFEGLDGETYSFPHPLFMEGAQAELLNSEEGTQSDKVRELLGATQYEKFMAHKGHRESDVMLEFLEAGREGRDLMGDGTPTQSSTS